MVVVAVSWTQAARELVDRVGVGMDAVWSLVYAAQSGVLHLALVEALDKDLSLTSAGMDLADALGELEWVRPELAANSLALDLGPARRDAVNECRSAVAGLMTAALEVAAGLLDGQGEELATAEVLALGRVVHRVGSASTRVSGRLV